jgi:hypothetical protein
MGRDILTFKIENTYFIRGQDNRLNNLHFKS